VAIFLVAALPRCEYRDKFDYWPNSDFKMLPIPITVKPTNLPVSATYLNSTPPPTSICQCRLRLSVPSGLPPWRTTIAWGN